MLWAFAREGGVPYSKYIARVSQPSPNIPPNLQSPIPPINKKERVFLKTPYLTPHLHLLGRPPHLPPPLLHLSNSPPQPPPRPNKHRLLNRLRRLHLPHRGRVLLLLHRRRQRHALRAPDHSPFKTPLGSFPPRPRRRPGHGHSDRVFGPGGVFLHVAACGEARCGGDELVRVGVWGRFAV